MLNNALPSLFASLQDKFEEAENSSQAEVQMLNDQMEQQLKENRLLAKRIEVAISRAIMGVAGDVVSCPASNEPPLANYSAPALLLSRSSQHCCLASSLALVAAEKTPRQTECTTTRFLPPILLGIFGPIPVLLMMWRCTVRASV